MTTPSHSDWCMIFLTSNRCNFFRVACRKHTLFSRLHKILLFGAFSLVQNGADPLTSPAVSARYRLRKWTFEVTHSSARWRYGFHKCTLAGASETMIWNFIYRQKRPFCTCQSIQKVKNGAQFVSKRGRYPGMRVKPPPPAAPPSEGIFCVCMLVTTMPTDTTLFYRTFAL